MKAIDAVVDEQGRIHLSEPFKVSGTKRAVLLILDEDSRCLASAPAIVSEPAISDWNRPEEDEAVTPAAGSIVLAASVKPGGCPWIQSNRS